MEDFYRFGVALAELRREQGVSVEALAAALGLDVERVQQWETGDERPTVAQVERALRVLQADHGTLIEWLERLEIEGGGLRGQ